MTAPTRSLNDGEVFFYNLVYTAIFSMFFYSVRHGVNGGGGVCVTSFFLILTLKVAMLFRQNELPRRALWLARGWSCFWVIATFWTTFLGHI